MLRKMSPTRSEPSSSTRDCGNARESEHPPLYAPRTKEGRRPSPSHLELLEQLRVDERDRLDVREDAHHLLHRQDRPGVRELRVAQRVVVLVEQRRHALDVVLLGRDDLLEHLRLLQPLLLRVGAPRRAVRRRGDRGDRQQLALGPVARELEHRAHLHTSENMSARARARPDRERRARRTSSSLRCLSCSASAAASSTSVSRGQSHESRSRRSSSESPIAPARASAAVAEAARWWGVPKAGQAVRRPGRILTTTS